MDERSPRSRAGSVAQEAGRFEDPTRNIPQSGSTWTVAQHNSGSYGMTSSTT